MSDQYEYVEVESEEQADRILVGELLGDEAERKKVVGDLVAKYGQAQAEREAKKRQWEKWRDQAEATKSERASDMPYPNASRVVPPLAWIVFQALYAHLKGMYDKVDPPWYIEPLLKGDSGFVKKVKSFNRLMNMMSKSKSDLNFSGFKRSVFYEISLMGTGFFHVPWTTKTWKYKQINRESGANEFVEAVVHDGPETQSIPIEDVIYPENWEDIQTMPWIAIDFPVARYELEDGEAAGLYDPASVEAILGAAGRGAAPAQAESRDRIKRSAPSHDDEVVLTQYWYFYDADKDGVSEDLILIVHNPTQTLLSVEYNEFGYRMLGRGVFVERSFGLEGRGSGQVCQHLQDEIEAIHNLRNDNMKFANMRMLAVREGALTEDEEVWPGKVFVTADPKDDIVPIQLGEVYPSSLNAEHMTMSYAREASGMSSIMSGFSDQTLGTRDTFRGQNLRMSRGEGLFATIAEGLNEMFNEIGMMIFFQMVHNRDRVIENEKKIGRLTEEEQEDVADILNMDLKDVPFRMAFRIRTSDIDQTFEAKRQNMLSLSQLFTQFAMQTTPLAQELFGPMGQQMKQTAPDAYQHSLSIYVASTKMMRQMIEFFGEDDPDQYVPDVRKHEFLLEMMKNMTTGIMEQLKEGEEAMSAQANAEPQLPAEGIEDMGFDLEGEM